ncbi:MAG: DUF4268 domain-containing protein [Acidobacteriia bacterium]|nr:DUF4268 domain-containing protein [Terriglobia bacterium]
MKVNPLGRFIKVDLREVFASEASDFTPWLAQQENLTLLAETIGIELQLEAQEKDVGPFRADILCKDTSSDNWVLIENQVERTDHTHLGQLLTYAAGLQAVTIVWIAERFTDEHRATLDWLNEKTDEQINFFGLEIELWRIGDSPVAPKFNVVSQPNDWSRTVQAAARETGEITEHKQKQLRFWIAFRDYMEKNSKIRCQKAYPQHWMNHSIGRTGFHLASIASMWNSATSTNKPEIRVELTLTGDKAKQHFVALERQREQIEKACGVPLTWHNPTGKNMCRIYTRQDADFLREELWPQQQQWLRETLELFQRVFAPIIQNLDSEVAVSDGP